MRQFIPLVLLSVLAGSANAMFFWGPHGAVEVEQKSYGFSVISLNGGGITEVSRTPTGYVIVPPNEPATFIDINEEEMQGEDLLEPTPFLLIDEVN